VGILGPQQVPFPMGGRDRLRRRGRGRCSPSSSQIRCTRL
jgi:hypothetical protein